MIWFGCTSNCSHRSAKVLSSRKAAKATRALNVGLWVRRVRRPDAFFLTIKNSFSPDFQPGIMPRVSTYRAVQFCRATSLLKSLFRPFLVSKPASPLGVLLGNHFHLIFAYAREIANARSSVAYTCL